MTTLVIGAGVIGCHTALRVDMRVAPQGGFAGFAHMRRGARAGMTAHPCSRRLHRTLRPLLYRQ